MYNNLYNGALRLSECGARKGLLKFRDSTGDSLVIGILHSVTENYLHQLVPRFYHKSR